MPWVEKKLKINLAPLQKQAVIKSLTEKAHIITGGPGTGKSTIIHAILTVFDNLITNAISYSDNGDIIISAKYNNNDIVKKYLK